MHFDVVTVTMTVIIQYVSIATALGRVVLMDIDYYFDIYGR